MIRAQLEDGRILEFPDGTDQSIIDAKVKELLNLAPDSATSPTPTPPVPSKPPEGTGGSSPQGFVSNLLEPENVGATAGSVAAGVAGMGLLSTVPLAALGGAAGEAYKQLGQHLSGSLDAPRTSLEAARRIGKAAARQGGFELVGGLAVKGLGKLLAPYKGTLEEGIKEVTDFFKDKIKPLVFMPAESTTARSLDLLHNIAESSVVGGNKIAQFKNKRTKFFEDFADSIIDQFGQRTDPADLGNLFVAAIEENKKVHAEAARVLYNNVDKLADNVTVPTSSLKKFVKPMGEISSELGNIEAKNAGDDLVSAILDLPNELDFKTAVELRSRLLSRVDEFSVLNKKAPAIGKAKKLISILDRNIEESLGPEALEAWRTANRFYKDGQKKFNNTLIRRLVKFADDTGTGAEMIAPAIFKPGHVSAVRKVKTALANNPEEWRKLQGFFVQHLLSKATSTDGVIMGKRLINLISGKPNSFGLPMLKETFTPQQIKSLQMLGRALQTTQSRQAEGAGRVLIQLTQAGALGSLATGKMALPATTIIIGPAILSRMMLNPKVAKLLTEGVSMPAGSAQAASLLARIVAAAED